MKSDFYNSNDDEFKHVVKLLKELPKVKAPDNFEYNLSIRIKNKQFLTRSEERNFFIPWKILIPASGTIVTVLILFFSFFSENENFENPFQTKPMLRSELNANFTNSQNNILNVTDNNKISPNDVVIQEKKVQIKSKSSTQQVKNSIEPPTMIASFPFDESNSTNLDEVINNEQDISRIDRRASLVGRSQNNSFFKGFYIREEINKKEFEALKARNDSLLKALQNQRDIIRNR